MGKKMFILIVILMSVSLIGIISVQLYWINNAIDSKDTQFKSDVTVALAAVSERIKLKEEDDFYRQVDVLFKTKQLVDSAQIRNYLIQKIDTSSMSKFTFGSTILEEDIKIPLDFVDSDTVFLKRITEKKDVYQAKFFQDDLGDLNKTFDEKRYTSTFRRIDLEKKYLNSVLIDFRNTFPIEARVSNRELSNTIKDELEKRNIHIDFKYGVYNKDGLATKLKSGYYTIKPTKESYQYPLFKDVDGSSSHQLYVSFPTKNKHILSGISQILLLSLFFIFIIILAFSSSLYQLLKQKKISEIKTDFINNMTHEFKTPIATINLALDSIKNPKIIENQEKVLRYVKMIRDENKRMHGQVENVLRISKLEKNQLEISKETIDVQDLLEDAISHVALLTQNKNGSLTTHFSAIQSEFMGNKFHITNVFVNMLENALKYSVNPPKIDVFTESTQKFITIKIKDEGIGMSKQAQRHAFDKFYREQKGNIHDVKGHGLGLAYVKEIVDIHHGTIFVESEKGKGSTFTVKLPLI